MVIGPGYFSWTRMPREGRSRGRMFLLPSFSVVDERVVQGPDTSFDGKKADPDGSRAQLARVRGEGLGYFS